MIEVCSKSCLLRGVGFIFWMLCLNICLYCCLRWLIVVWFVLRVIFVSFVFEWNDLVLLIVSIMWILFYSMKLGIIVVFCMLFCDMFCCFNNCVFDILYWLMFMCFWFFDKIFYKVIGVCDCNVKFIIWFKK